MITESEMVLDELKKEFEQSISEKWTREEIVDFIQKKIDFINRGFT